jgi:hypothetical protein
MGRGKEAGRLGQKGEERKKTSGLRRKRKRDGGIWAGPKEKEKEGEKRVWISFFSNSFSNF